MRNILYPTGKATYIQKNASIDATNELFAAQQESDAFEKSVVNIVT